jgi:membrane protein
MTDAAAQPEPSTTPARRAPRLRETLRVAHVAARGLLRSRLPQMAAALAYRTIFGLAPVTVISFAILGAFATEEQITQVVERAMEYTGLKGVEIPDASGTIPEEELEPAAEGEQPASLDQWIAGLVDNVSKLKFGAIGAIGVVILIYAAIGMVVEVERAFNHIYRAAHGRSWTRRLTQYWTTLTLGALLLVATFYVGGRTKFWLTGLVQADQISLFQSIWVGAVGFSITVAISTLMLLLIYTTVPNARVRVPPALAGAFVAAILWEASKWGFTQYLTYSTGITRVYGSLAILPLFLLWIYITWLVVLFGLQVAYGLQHFAQLEEDVEDHDDQPTVLEPAALIVLAGHLADHFRRGESLTTDAAADRLATSEALAARLLERLQAAGVARRAADSGGSDDGWVLARPAEHIALVDIFDAACALRPPPDTDAIGAETVESLHQCQRDRLKGRPLASLLPEPEPASEPEPRSEADSDA